MPKKEKVGRTDDDLLPDVEKMKQQGKSKEEIRKELGIGMERLYRLLNKLESKSVNPSGDIQIPPPTEQDIIDGTVKKATTKIVDNLSEKYSKEYVGSMQAAAILKEMEMRYKLTVEAWGYRWEDFVRQAIDYGFQKAQELEKLVSLLQLLEVMNNE